MYKNLQRPLAVKTEKYVFFLKRKDLYEAICPQLQKNVISYNREKNKRITNLQQQEIR